MYQRLSKRVNTAREDGFTLIELLIVIVILGILAGIVVFAVGTASTDSKLSACKADKKTLSTALEAYKAKNGSYPTTAQSSSSNDLVSNFLKTWPGGADYTFTAAATSGAVTVGNGTGSGTPAPPTGC